MKELRDNDLRGFCLLPPAKRATIIAAAKMFASKTPEAKRYLQELEYLDSELRERL
jgi:hypothetical protein